MLLAGFLSVLFPGLGQIQNRQLLKGSLLIMVELVILYVTVPGLLMIILYRSLWIYAVIDAIVVAQLIRKNKKDVMLRRNARDFLPVILTALLVLPIGWLPAFMPQIMHDLAIQAQQPDIPEEQLEKDLEAYQSYLTRKYNMKAAFGDETFSEANGHYTVTAVPEHGRQDISFTISKDHNDTIRDTYIESLWSKDIDEELQPIVNQLYDNVWVFDTKITTFEDTDQRVLEEGESVPGFWEVYDEFPDGYRFWLTLYVFNDFDDEKAEHIKIYQLVEQLQRSGITLTGLELKFYDEALYEQAGKEMEPTHDHRAYASHFLSLNQQQLDGIQTPEEIADSLIKLEKFYQK